MPHVGRDKQQDPPRHTELIGVMLVAESAGLRRIDLPAPAVKPLLERCAALTRTLAKQQALYPQILVEVGPVDAVPCATDLESEAFRLCRISYPRIPTNRHADCAPCLTVSE